MLTLNLDPSFRLEYLAEGAANVVFRVRIKEPYPSTSADLYFESEGRSATTPSPTEIEPPPLPSPCGGKLVRLRKELSSTVPVIETQRHFEDLIAPLFPKEYLVEQILFHPTAALLKDCNVELRRLEKERIRHEKRHGVYLDENEKYGYLITDMTCDSDSEYELFEFKPKWLAQSPNAPVESRRCRTCALQAMRRIELRESNHQPPNFCPLDLVSTDILNVDRAVKAMSGTIPSGTHETILRYLHQNPLLVRLRELQLELDPNGVLRADLTSSIFLAAMTLRDCTLFLKVR